MKHAECQSCHRDSPLGTALRASAMDLEKAAQTALETLRGVCLDCAGAALASGVGA